jgi:hypothetical protein
MEGRILMRLNLTQRWKGWLYKQMLFYDREMELYEKSNITFKIFFLIQFERLQMEWICLHCFCF